MTFAAVLGVLKADDVFAQQDPKVEIVPQIQHSSAVWAVAFSPDGKTIASGSVEGEIKLWNATAGRLLRTLQGHSSIGHVNSVRKLSFSPDSQYLVSSGNDGAIKLWGVGDGKLLKTFSGKVGNLPSAAFTPDGRQLFVGGLGGPIGSWDIASGKLRTFQKQVRSSWSRGHVMTTCWF